MCVRTKNKYELNVYIHVHAKYIGMCICIYTYACMYKFTCECAYIYTFINMCQAMLTNVRLASVVFIHVFFCTPVQVGRSVAHVR